MNHLWTLSEIEKVLHSSNVTYLPNDKMLDWYKLTHPKTSPCFYVSAVQILLKHSG